MTAADIERLNRAITHGSKGYEEWNKIHALPDYLTAILYTLILQKKATQAELVAANDLPKQSINKGIKFLRQKGYLTLKVDPADKRMKFCQLTPTGQRFAQLKVKPLFSLEKQVAGQLGSSKIKQLAVLAEEWSQTFWQDLKEKEDK